MEDTGYGMTQEGIDGLFQDFAMLEENRKFNNKGTGLGLSICKNIIENMGGSVEVLSQVGTGSIFKVEMSCPYLDA